MCLSMTWHSKLVHDWMVHTDLAPRRQQFHIAPAMQQPNSAVSTPLWCIRAIKGYSHSFRITCDMSSVSLLESREQRYIKAINNNNNNKVYGQTAKLFRGRLTFFLFTCTTSLYCMGILVLSCRFPAFPPGLSVSLLACLPLYPVFVVLSSFFLFLKYLPFFSFIFLSFFLFSSHIFSFCKMVCTDK